MLSTQETTAFRAKVASQRPVFSSRSVPVVGGPLDGLRLWIDCRVFSGAIGWAHLNREGCAVALHLFAGPPEHIQFIRWDRPGAHAEGQRAT